jgi:hypothetical protein
MKRISSILKGKGLIGTTRMVFEQLKRGVVQSHFYVVGHNIPQDNPMPVTEADLEIKQITISDSNDIDELTEIDEWQIPKSATLKMFKEGQICYIAKQQNRIVACQWVIIRRKFREYYLQRELRLSPNEAYNWRGFTVPSFRGKGILPFLVRYEESDIVRRFGKTFILGWVRTNNQSMLRALSKLEWTRIGRIGFFQVLGIRFHYLRGRHAFERTRPRFKIQILW